MVNTGKPSRGCYMCRARRIKCDEAKPHCMRCQKSKRVCPGYRDAFELNHRDETKSTKKKTPQARGKTGSTFIDLPSGLESSVTPVHPVWMYNPNMSSWNSNQFDQQSSPPSWRVGQICDHISIHSHLSTPLDQQASCFFLSNFVVLPQQGAMTRYLDFVVPLLKISKPNSPMDLSFSACAVAAFGARSNSKSLLQRADHFYTRALNAINTALKHPKMAKDDATLASVFLLSTFEQIVSSRKTTKGWMCHIDGAVALVKARGPEQFQSAIGREIFLAVRSHKTIQCIATAEPIAADVNWWMDQLPEDQINRAVNEINLKVAELLGDTEEVVTLIARTASNTEKVLKLLRRSEALEQEYIAWEKSLPDFWRPTTVAWVDSTEGDLASSAVHPGRVDSYGEIWMAFTHIIARSCRLFVWTTTLRCVAWLGELQDYKLTPEYTVASRVCSQLIEDIVASIPYFFGWNGNGTVPWTTKAANYACGTNERTSSIKAASGIFMLWPAFTAASSDFSSTSQRLFLRGKIQCVHQSTGVTQADMLLKRMLSHPSMFIQRERLNMGLANSPDASPARISCQRGLEIDNDTKLVQINQDQQLTPPPSASTSSPVESKWAPRFKMQDNGGAHPSPSGTTDSNWTTPFTTQDNTSSYASTTHSADSSWIPRGIIEANRVAHDLDYLQDYPDGLNMNFDVDYDFSNFVAV